MATKKRRGCRSPQDDGPQEGPAEFKLTSLSLGKNHNCGVSETGTVICWGNGFCQEGTCTSNSLGALTGPAGTYTTVTAGDSYTCALPSPATHAILTVLKAGESVFQTFY